MMHLVHLLYGLPALWLMQRDTARRTGISGAVWLPTLWVGIIATKPFGAWLGLGGGSTTLDGSPIDALFFFSVIIVSTGVLARRHLAVGKFTAENWSVILFYLFLLLSILWANSTFSSFKRWFKEFGNIVVVLVILTEARPTEALKAIFIRCALAFIPLSIIYVRYFPWMGRRYNIGGFMEVTGVTLQKNTLGALTALCGLMILWDWLERPKPGPRTKAIDRYLPHFLALCCIYTLYISNSKTSMICLIVGSFIVISARFPLLRRRISAYGMYAILLGGLIYALDATFGLKEMVVSSLGRDMTFTGRTEVWKELMAAGTDPVVGTGFMSFWDDPYYRSRLPYWVSSSAHNGYLDIYLATGTIGVSLLGLMILATGARINRALNMGDSYSVVRFALFLIGLIANFSESNFAAMTPINFLFLLASIGVAPRTFPLVRSFPSRNHGARPRQAYQPPRGSPLRSA